MSASMRQSLARAGYSLLLRGVVPLYRLRLLWRGRREPLYATAIGERFGRYREPFVPGALWLHAVSLGETRAMAPLVDALRAARPDLRFVFTHGTATGRAAGEALLRNGDRQVWLPFDTPGAVRRFLHSAKPIAGVLMETEIWPNLLAAAARDGVPVVLANARLSARSRRRGKRVDALLRPAFASLAAALAQSDDDAKRLRDAGARDVSVVGNLKYDLAPDPQLLARGRAWRDGIAGGIVVAASTREGEEADLLAAWRANAAPRPLLVVVPRHPQRFDAVAELIENAGFTLSRRSAWHDGQPPRDAGACDVWLGDSMLEMPAWYALGDVALLGGSFAPLGGQNLIEAAACGCPLVLGPHTFNFSAAAELAIGAGAAVRVADIGSAVAAAVALVSPAEAPQRTRRSDAAFAFAGAHRGAAARMAARILHVAERRGAR